MDCKSARLLLDYYRPNSTDLASEDVSALEQHLTCCPECAALTRGQHQADSLIGRAMRHVEVPDRLRERLLTRVQTERRDLTHRKLGWVVRGVVAAAAVLLIAIGAWFAIWRNNQPPVLNLPPVVQPDINKFSNPTPEIVAAWYQDQLHGPFTAPPNFDYSFLRYYGFVEIQGKRVPELIFAQGTMRARVLVVNREQFKLDNINKSLPEDLSGAGIEVWGETSSFTDIVIYSGNDRNELGVLFTKEGVNWLSGATGL
jgi:hypothetical protein